MATSRAPMMAQPPDGHSGEETKPQARPRTTAEPAPLPRDPEVLAEIRAGIDRGLSQARAGIGYDLDEVLADMDRKIAAHRR